ncbi:MAG: outer membrane beta-barrel protein [Candidatus Sulfotelmatobacter sp.]|jgi:opacity protein-like surface antigen
MRKSLAVGLWLGLLGAAPLAKAQEEPSKVDIYGGYYYARFNVNANVPGIAPSATYFGKGGGGQLEYNLKNWLGVVGDLAGFYATSSDGSFAGGVFTYLLGPRVNFRRGKFTPFVQALFGGVRTTDGIAQSTGAENNFAMTAGGGIDVKVSRNVSVRPIQAEYFMTKIPDGLNNRQDNLRIGVGIVFHLGK